jgi:branched-chain amino acid transport system ATP-binding protein
LLIEQNVKRALDVVDRFYALERGQVVLSGDAASESACASLMDVIAV